MPTGRTRRPALPVALAALLTGLALLWPAAVNGGAFLFSDTTAYVRGADAAVVTLFHHKTGWSDELAAPAAPVRPGTTATPPSLPAGDRVVLAGRSIYYGALLYFGLLTHSFWPVVLLQAGLAAIVLARTMARFTPAPGRVTLPAAAGLVAVAALTPASYYAAFAMPDLFAALAVVAGAHVAFAWRRESRGWRAFWLGLLAAAALFHSATVLILAVLAAGLALLRWRRAPAVADGRLWPLLLAIALAIGGEALFAAAVRHATGHPPVRPPFLSARLVDDGPGMAYLRHHCGDPQPALLCRQRARLPMPSDTFLWAPDAATGGFKSLPPDEQRALAADDGAFVARVVRAEPAAVLAAALRDAGRQAVATRLAEFNYGEGLRATFREKVPMPERRELATSAAWRRAMPTALAEALTLPLALLSLATIAAAALAGQRTPALWCAAWLTAGVAINDVACGALSGPHDRYGARMVWLLPLAATLVLAAWAQARRGRAA